MVGDELFSKRAKEWALAKTHQLTPTIRAEYLEELKHSEEEEFTFRKRFSNSSFNLEFWGKIVASEKNPAILRSLHYSGDLSQKEQAYLEAFCHLAQGKSRLKLLKISSREIEHFLRDQNDLPALYPPTEKKMPLWGDDLLLFVAVIIEEMLIFEGQRESSDNLENYHLGESPTLPDQLRLLETFFDQQIRKGLILDGGNVVIKALNQEGSVTQVYLDFTGACQSCASAKKGTWQFIQTLLEKYFKGKVVALAY